MPLLPLAQTQRRLTLAAAAGKPDDAALARAQSEVEAQPRKGATSTR